MYDDSELSKLLAEIRKPFTTSRDVLWDNRRAIRYRRHQPWVPKNLKAAISADDMPLSVYYRDSLPGFVINRIKQRLGSNDIDIQVKTRGDAGPAIKKKGENLEDWLRGVLDELDPVGLIDSRVREHQAADGVGFLKLEFARDFIPPERNDETDGDYDDLVADARQKWGLPIGASAPDPRSLYWIEANDQVKIMCEVLNLPLVEVKNKYAADGYTINLADEIKGVLGIDAIVAGQLTPAPTPAEYGRMVRLVVISDSDYFYHCLYPNTSPAGMPEQEPFGELSGTAPPLAGLICIAKYPNPLGRPPYFPAAGRSTGDPSPAYKYEPLALEVLDTAEVKNNVMTWRQFMAVLEATKPVGVKPRLPKMANENAAPKHIPNMWKPGFLEIDGDFLGIPSPEAKAFDALVTDIKAEENQYNLSIMGALSSGTVGKSAPAWTVMQFNEEQVGMLKEALDSRSVMWREGLKAVCQLARDKYGQHGAVYVRSRGPNRKEKSEGDTEMLMGLKSEDFNIPWRMVVSIEALTQSQRAANTEYFRELHTEGTLSDMSYQEEIGIKDPGQEQARKDREFLMAPMRKAALAMGLQNGANKMFLIHGPVVLPILQSVGLPAPTPDALAQGGMPLDQGQPGAPQGMAAGGAPPTGVQNIPPSPVMPGQGMSTLQPEPGPPRQIAAPNAMANGTSA